MEERYPEQLYSKVDLEKAYTSGLEYSVTILERTIGLPPIEQIIILGLLKKMIINRKIKATMDSP